MKETRYLVPFAVAAAMTALASPVGAALETFDVDYGSASSPPSVPFSTDLSLNKFDPSLGTLTGVTIELFTYDTITVDVYNSFSGNKSYTQATGSQPVTVTALDGLTTTATGSASFNGTAAPGLNVLTSSPIPAQNSASVGSSDFSLYEGAGGQQFIVQLASGQGSYSGTSVAGVFFGGSSISDGEVEVDYAYTPVPEPGALAAGLLALGVVGFELARRRILGRA